MPDTQKKNAFQVFLNGLITENPTFVLMLGMCPTLGVTTAAMNGIGMGLATTAVLICSNLLISLLRNIISERIRIPAFIVGHRFLRVHCGNAAQGVSAGPERCAGRVHSLDCCKLHHLCPGGGLRLQERSGGILWRDGLGMGLGFTCAITILSAIRELLGSGTIFGAQLMPESYEPMAIMLQVPGGFITLGLLLILVNAIRQGFGPS